MDGTLWALVGARPVAAPIFRCHHHQRRLTVLMELMTNADDDAKNGLGKTMLNHVIIICSFESEKNTNKDRTPKVGGVFEFIIAMI